LLARSVRIPTKRQEAAAPTIPNLDLHHELRSQLPLRYCSVCTKPPTKKRKRTVLGKIISNSQSISKSTEAQKRRKTRFGCVKCGVATCNENGCFQKHCNTTNST
jgi:hypothetical protein